MTLRIDKLTMREIRLPLREPFAISSGETTTRRILLLEVVDRDGVVAWAECVAGEFPNYSPETVDTAWLAIRDWLAPRIVATEFPSVEALARSLFEDLRGHRMAAAAVEMAAWCLAAERGGVSLSALLGGTRDRIATGISIGLQPDAETLVEKAAAALSEGYRKVKIKIKPGADLEFLRAARLALGPDAPIMADANNAYTLADLDHLRLFDELDLLMIEQPLAWDDIVRHADLQRVLATPICLDESITGIDKAEDMIALQAGRIINIKPGRVGGLLASRAIHDLCAQQSIPVWCGGMLESGIGRAYNVALASLDNFTLPGDVSPSRRYWRQDIVSPEWTMDEDGFVEVPSTPGLGVEVDTERVEALTVRREDLN